MSESPLVSIIIPTYNRANVIGETLDSVLAQTYQNWECLVVDDGSTDTTEKVVGDYVNKDNRFQYHKRPNTHFPGGNGARNYGFEVSTGKYVNWFDDDDVMYPEKLATQVPLLHDTTYDYTVCQTLMYDVVNDKPLGLRAQHLTSKSVFQDFICFKVFWLTQAPLWKCTFLKAHKFQFDETLKQSQDYDFHIRVLDVSENYSITDEVLLKVNCHEGNMSVSLVTTIAKLSSNLKVKADILSKYNAKLNKETKRSVYNHILHLYRDAVLTRDIAKIKLVAHYLYKFSKASGISFFKRMRMCLKLMIGTFLYCSFRKGYTYINYKI